ncbi:MAG: ferritin family protein [bacterium]
MSAGNKRIDHPRRSTEYAVSRQQGVAMDTERFEQIIRAAIADEIESRDFYKAAAERVEDRAVKEIFQKLSADEEAHRNTLHTFVSDPTAVMAFQKVEDFQVAEAQELPALSLDMAPKDALQLAIKKEQGAMEGYQALAKAAEDSETRRIFNQLSDMERGHKARLESLFVDVAYPEAW